MVKWFRSAVGVYSLLSCCLSCFYINVQIVGLANAAKLIVVIGVNDQHHNVAYLM